MMCFIQELRNRGKIEKKEERYATLFMYVTMHTDKYNGEKKDEKKVKWDFIY